MAEKISNGQTGKLDVSEIIDGLPLSSLQIRVFILCGLTAMIDGFDTQCVGFIAPVVMAEWNVDSASFGFVISAGLLGVLIGSLALSPLADRFGRRRLIIVSTLVFGVLSLVTALAESMQQLLVLRFLTGLGLGGAVPNLIALTSEYAPKRLKSLMVVVMFSGFPLGAFIGGVVASRLIEVYGWESVFVFGGIAPLVLAVFLYFLLPESILFLIGRKQRQQSAGNSGATSEKPSMSPVRYLNQISPNAGYSDDQLSLPEESRPNMSVRDLFSDGRAVGTMMLWIIFLCTLMMFYFMISWLPSILANAGAPVGAAILAALFLNAGSVAGGIYLARRVDRSGSIRFLVGYYIGAAICYSLVGFAESSLALVGFILFCGGFFVGGAQLVANALASMFYPTSIRASGVGWAFGAGRVGSLTGPAIGGFLLATTISHENLFLIAAVPALVAAVASFVLSNQLVLKPRASEG